MSSLTAPIDGSWELVCDSVGGKPREDGKISQFKMLHDGFFSLIMQDLLANGLLPVQILVRWMEMFIKKRSAIAVFPIFSVLPTGRDD